MGFYKNGSSTWNKCEKQLQSFEVSIQIIFWKPNHWIAQVVKYVHTSQYIGEFEMLILSSQIVIGEFWLISSYAVRCT